MPRFFIDLDDGQAASHDFDGSELADARMARKRALALLAETVCAVTSDDDVRTFRVDLRDANRKVIYRATLSLRSLWIEPT